MATSRKPSWIKVRLPGGETHKKITSMLRSKSLHTVCEEARCPNLGECWSGGTATIMLMGDICTRGCRFCAVKTGNPKGRLDALEPQKTAQTVASMGLSYVVLTSVDRDDLEDGGAWHFAQTVRAIHQQCPSTLVETLVPDFQGDVRAIETLLDGNPNVFAHNLETVSRLTRLVRDRRAGYSLSLSVLEEAKRLRPNLWTKSSLMLGLGETEAELHQAFRDLRNAGVDFLTLGQYLQPSVKHIPVTEYLHPDRFEAYKIQALEFGFHYVASGPLVRSSYKAGEFFIESMVRRNAPLRRLPSMNYEKTNVFTTRGD